MKSSKKSVIIAILITISFVFVVGVVSSVFVMSLSDYERYMSLISGAAQLIYLAAAVLILKIRKNSIAKRCNLSPIPITDYIIPAGAGLCFSVFSNILQTIIPIPDFLVGESVESLGDSIAAFIAAIYIIAPFTEEFVFRGLIMTSVRQTMGAFLSVCIGAVLFGVIHLMTSSVVTGIHALLGGLIFGLSYEKTGSLFAAIAAHFAGNLGGLISYIELNFSVKIIAVILSGAASVLLCLLLIKKKSKLQEKFQEEKR